MGVMSDRMLPLMRKTWMRIEELEKAVARPNDGCTPSCAGSWAASCVGSKASSTMRRPSFGTDLNPRS